MKNKKEFNCEAQKRMGEAQGIINYHKILMKQNKWVKNDEARNRFIKQIKREIDGLTKEEAKKSA